MKEASEERKKTRLLWLCLPSHLRPAPIYQLPFLLIFATGVTFSAPEADAHTPIHTRSKSAASRRNLFFLLPFESSVVSPPLYSWGAPTKTPPTFYHVGNKSASFIPIFSRLSAASLFGYLVWPLSRSEGCVARIGCGIKKKNTEKNTLSKIQLTPEVDSNIHMDWIKHWWG